MVMWGVLLMDYLYVSFILLIVPNGLDVEFVSLKSAIMKYIFRKMEI